MQRPEVIGTTFLLLTSLGCSMPATSENFLDVAYRMTRQYTGMTKNELTIEPVGEVEDSFSFAITSPGSVTSVEQDVYHPLSAQSITFTYGTEGAHYVDFKVRKWNNSPYLFEVIPWEFSTERPDQPTISFLKEATKSLTNSLTVSDSRISNTTGIWLAGDLTAPAGAETEDEGYWTPLALTDVAVPVTLTPGDGVKVVDAKFRNIYGNAGELGASAEIILKQTPPTDCSAEATSETIASTRLRVQLRATDPYPVYYSASGDLQQPVAATEFTSGDIVELTVPATEGPKTVSVSIEDIAGNYCLVEDITVNVDTGFVSERIDVQGSTYWTDSEDLVLDVYFDHTAAQEPLEYKITGHVSGPNTNTWLSSNEDIAVRLNPTTSGSRLIYAQYRDAQGNESYLIAKRIFLKPTVSLQDTGGGIYNVVVSRILDAASISIAGCNEIYTEVAWEASFQCTLSAADVDVTYHFADDTTLTKSAAP